MRKYLIAGNWKMHGSLNSVQALTNSIQSGLQQSHPAEVLVLPTFVHLPIVKTHLQNTSIKLGAQNLYVGEKGAFTGEVSGEMLKDIGCEYVLIGHSERRTVFKEDLNLIANKFKSAVEARLKPILCVGETHAERTRGETESVVHNQIQSVIDHCGIAAFRSSTIAYEPVWAIGTGLTATPELAQIVHAAIRAQIAQNDVDLAAAMRILYGGSMKPDNAEMLLAMPDIDGGLIGGASLEAESFLAICRAVGG